MEDRRNFSGGNGWGFINILEWDSQGFWMIDSHDDKYRSLWWLSDLMKTWLVTSRFGRMAREASPEICLAEEALLLYQNLNSKVVSFSPVRLGSLVVCVALLNSHAVWEFVSLY